MSISALQTLDKDIYWMKRALELAARGIGVSSPNPAVGCVILDRAGQVVGEGWHEYDLLDHAEVVALNEAKQHALTRQEDRLKGGTLYVTLEPCNHTGRTGPCTEAIARAGIKRVVVATMDPNPHVQGGGTDHLRALGVEVVTGILEEEAKRLIQPWTKYITKGASYLSLKLAISLDGRVATRTGIS